MSIFRPPLFRLLRVLALVALITSLPRGADAAEPRIRLGICTSIDNGATMGEIGYDYVELSLSGVAAMSEEEFAALKEKVAAAKVKPEAMNGFMKKPLVVVGPEAELGPVEGYMKQAFARADALGIKVLVYGSAGTRAIPEGFPRERAEEQLIEFLRLASDTAKPYPGLTITLEPLRPQESNFINTVREGLDLVRRVDRPNVRAMADLYHMGVQGETMEAIRDGGREWIRHAHIARTEGRAYPAAGDASDAYYKEFFTALREIGYDGRVSVEGRAEEFAKDARTAHACLRALADGAESR